MSALAADPFDLARFVRAQNAGGSYRAALAEVRAGIKRTHWMWFVFPQLRGLGRSDLASRYGVTGEAEARAYLAHPVLGPRLVECAEAVLRHAGRPASALMGAIDALKLRSSATLFAEVSPPGSVYERVLGAFYDGEADGATMELLERERTL